MASWFIELKLEDTDDGTLDGNEEEHQYDYDVKSSNVLSAPNQKFK